MSAAVTAVGVAVTTMTTMTAMAATMTPAVARCCWRRLNRRHHKRLGTRTRVRTRHLDLDLEIVIELQRAIIAMLVLNRWGRRGLRCCSGCRRCGLCRGLGIIEQVFGHRQQIIIRWRLV